ncbi:multiple epidermal growth factor-like domains protein 10 isoform X2 [Bolinopsis microptera]|uniref:multiple epidermal growth factor-like domains protein 10 isoform X2 n=1 Tax=Bolinopsis microptera TaxID=2820187 RepID=UPI003078BD79
MLFILVGLIAATTVSGEFTLVDRRGQQIVGEAQGLLLYNGGTVCDDSFNENSGNAVCRQMGYDRAQTWNSHVTWAIQEQYEIVLDDVICDDSGSWDSCSYVESHNCGHSEDIFLTCKEAPRFTLVDSAGEIIRGEELGLLLYNGGTVCDDNFDNNAANAICRKIGYTGATRWTPADSFDIQTDYEIKLDNVECRRGEWESCSYSESHNCMHREDVFLSCDGEIEQQSSDIPAVPTVPTVPTDTEEPLFRLVDSEGNVIEGEELGLLLYKGGTVCDDSFDATAATAICRNLGYTDMNRWSSRGTRIEIQDSYEITLDNVDCSDPHWGSCSFSEENNCGHIEDVFLSCNSEEPTEAGHSPFSLIDADSNDILGEEQGLLLYNGNTVCDDSFDENAANAICRQMGRPGSLGWIAGSLFDIQTGLEIGLDNVDCSSESWSSCTHSTVHNCQHNEDVHLTCSATVTNTPAHVTEVPEFATDPADTEPPQLQVETDPPQTCPPILECPTSECYVTCPAGHYLINSTCEECPANFYSSVSGSTSCSSCPGISTSRPGSDKCNCRPGTMWSNGRCKRCPDDYAGVEGTCHQCPEGSQPVDSDRSCSCPDGLYWLWNHALLGACVPCPQDKFIEGEMLHCELCPTGSTALTGSSSCSCEAGTYWSNQECVECSPGFASNAGATVCVTCENGGAGSSCLCDDGLVWEWVDQNTGSCRPCLASTYKTGNMSSCSTCPLGSTSAAGAEHCSCPPGEHWSGEECNSCEAGSVSLEGSLSCSICPLGSSSTEEKCTCPDGTVWEWNSSGDGSCIPCSSGSYKNNEAGTCLFCPEGSTSLSGSAGCSCDGGKVWDGAQCVDCEEGTASNGLGTECLVCPLGAAQDKASCLCPDGAVWKWEDGQCSPCLQDTYKQGEMVSCEVCPSTSTTPAGSAECSCDQGTHWSNRACVMCTGTAWFDNAGKVCVECPAHTLPVHGHTACSCSAGSKWDPVTKTCTACPANHFSEGSSVECTKCPAYTVSTAGASQCNHCQNGEYWTNYTCETCNDSDQIGNGVFCVQQYDIETQHYKGSAKGIRGTSPRSSLSAIFTGIIVVLAVVCITLIVLLIAKSRKQKKKKVPRMSYSTAPLTGGSESDWQDMRADSVAAPAEERDYCGGGTSNPMPGSEENIYHFLEEPDQRF